VTDILETHTPEDELERYALIPGPEPLAEIVEEHLLLCPGCCDMLDELEEEIAVIRAALRTLEA
jgi:hypothetical protein